MQWQGLKLPVIFLAFICGLAIAFGGQWLFKEYSYQQPLQKILVNNKQIKSYHIDDQGAVTNIKLQLTDNTADLRETYRQVNQSIGRVLGNHPYHLELANNPDAGLKQLYYNSQYAIYQAQAAGTFPEMDQVIQAQAKKFGVQAKVFVDMDNIYIQLQKPDGHYYYQIIPRNNPVSNGLALRGGAQFAQGN